MIQRNRRQAFVLAVAIIGWTNSAKSESKVEEISRFVSKSWVAKHINQLWDGKQDDQSCELKTANNEGDRLTVRKIASEVGPAATVQIAGEGVKGSKPKEVFTGRATVDEGEPVPLLVLPFLDHVPTPEPGGSIHFYWPDNPDLLGMMAGGKTISFTIGPKEVRFDLVGLDQAFVAYKKCVALIAEIGAPSR